MSDSISENVHHVDYNLRPLIQTQSDDELLLQKDAAEQVISQLAEKSLDELSKEHHKEEIVEKIRSLLDHKKISGIETLILSELSRNETWDKAVKVVNALRYRSRKIYDNSGPFYLDEEGVVNKFKEEKEWHRDPRDNIIEHFPDISEITDLKAGTLTTEIQIDEFGNIYLDTTKSRDPYIIGRELISSGEDRVGINLKTLREDPIWQSAVARLYALYENVDQLAPKNVYPSFEAGRKDLLP